MSQNIDFPQSSEKMIDESEESKSNYDLNSKTNKSYEDGWDYNSKQHLMLISGLSEPEIQELSDIIKQVMFFADNCFQRQYVSETQNEMEKSLKVVKSVEEFRKRYTKKSKKMIEKLMDIIDIVAEERKINKLALLSLIDDQNQVGNLVDVLKKSSKKNKNTSQKHDESDDDDEQNFGQTKKSQNIQEADMDVNYNYREEDLNTPQTKDKISEEQIKLEKKSKSNKMVYNSQIKAKNLDEIFGNMDLKNKHSNQANNHDEDDDDYSLSNYAINNNINNNNNNNNNNNIFNNNNNMLIEDAEEVYNTPQRRPQYSEKQLNVPQKSKSNKIQQNKLTDLGNYYEEQNKFANNQSLKDFLSQQKKSSLSSKNQDNDDFSQNENVINNNGSKTKISISRSYNNNNNNNNQK